MTLRKNKISEERVQRAVENFMQGYGCCQSVTAAFADLYGFTDQQAKLVSAGFGGGVGRMRMMCGAVSALVILAGMSNPEPTEQTDGDDIRKRKTACYKLVQELLAEFKQQNGSLICAELLRLGGCQSAVQGTFIPDERNAEYYKKRPCAAKVECAARIFLKYYNESLPPEGGDIDSL